MGELICKKLLGKKEKNDEVFEKRFLTTYLEVNMFDIMYLLKMFEIVDFLRQPLRIKWRKAGEKKSERTAHMQAENTFGEYYMDTREVIRSYMLYFYQDYERFYIRVV